MEVGRRGRVGREGGLYLLNWGKEGEQRWIDVSLGLETREFSCHSPAGEFLVRQWPLAGRLNWDEFVGGRPLLFLAAAHPS